MVFDRRRDQAAHAARSLLPPRQGVFPIPACLPPYYAGAKSIRYFSDEADQKPVMSQKSRLLQAEQGFRLNQ